MAAMISGPDASFTMNPDAPARRTSAARLALAYMVRKTTFAFRPSAWSWRSASSPLISGMARSVRITSGRRRRAAWSSLAPLATVPTSENSPRRRVASPSATTAWSSASSSVARGILGLPQGHDDPKLGPALWLRVDGQAPPDEADPLVEAEQAEPPPGSRLDRIEPATIVHDGEHDVEAGSLHRDLYLAGRGVLDDI